MSEIAAGPKNHNRARTCGAGFGLSIFIHSILSRPVILGSYPLKLSAGRAFHVAAKLIAHGRQKLQGELILTARAKSLSQCGAQYGGGHGLVDRRDDRPSSLAGIGNASGE